MQWVSQEILDGRARILQLSRLFRETKRDEVKINLRRKKQEIRNKVKEAKKQYYDVKIANSGNCVKSTWEIINHEVGKQKQNISNFRINCNGRIVSDPKIVSEIFNTFFTKKKY